MSPSMILRHIAAVCKITCVCVQTSDGALKKPWVAV